MALHFERREYAARVDIAAASLGDRGLDGLLMFAQESMYYTRITSEPENPVG